jgi:hypothetical protein
MFHSVGPRIRITMVGTIAVGAVAVLFSFSVVRAERMDPDKSKTYKCGSGTACVEGDSSGSKTWGVYGLGAVADGIHGVTSSTNGNSGTSGISIGTSGSAHGVYGRSSNGQGVYGISTTTNGVEGHSSGAGGSGVAGIQRGMSSNSGDGVYSESADTTNFYEAIEAKADSSNTYIFEGFNASTNGLCTIDYNAALAWTGSAYASESASATIEDVGTARMTGDVANVTIDPAFASVIDRKWYYVFVTPLGDTRGLYVSMKTPTAFQVREDGGDRLPPAPAMRSPRTRGATNDG